jgi:hypothetical protein
MLITLCRYALLGLLMGLVALMVACVAMEAPRVSCDTDLRPINPTHPVAP